MKKRNLMKVFVSLALGCVIAGGVSATDNVTASAADTTFKISDTISFDMSSFVTSPKAAVRYDAQTDDQGNEYTGMRFFTGIDPETRTALENLSSQGYTVSFGTIVTNYDTMKELTDFTFEYLPENTDEKTNYLDVKANAWVLDENKETKTDDSGYAWANMDQFSAVVYGITEANFATERIARGYVSVSKDGETQTYYASYTNESRSAADVAMSALQANDYDTEATDADEKEFKALNKFAQKSDEWLEKYAGYDYIRYISTFDELSTYATDDILKADGTENANVCLVMKNDIDLSNVDKSAWTICQSMVAGAEPSSVIPQLTSSLDGNGKALHQFALENVLKSNSGYERNDCMGFFGRISGDVRNLIFRGVLGAVDESYNLTSSVCHRNIGLFAWENTGTIENCYIEGAIYTAYTDSSATNRRWSVGMVFRNSGTIKSVLSDIYWRKRTYHQSNATASTTEDVRRYSFAVSNTGTVEDCIAVNQQYKTGYTVENGNYLRGWTTSAFLTSSTVGDGEYSYGDPFTAEGYNLPSTFYRYRTQTDANRSNCATFMSYTTLLSASGTGYGDDSKESVLMGYNTSFTSATAHTALGGAWTFDTTEKTISLCGTVVWQTA